MLVLKEEAKSKYCDYCCAKNGRLLKCAKCKNIFYCNKECQKEDWKWHKYECKFYRDHYEYLKVALPRLLLRLHLYLLNKPEMAEKEAVWNDITRSYNQLGGHQDKIRNDPVRMRIFDSIWPVFAQLLRVPLDEETFFTVYCKMFMNHYFTLDSELMPIAMTLYLLATKFDHSCAPNAVPAYTGRSLEIRAIKTIQPGDRITFCRTDLSRNKQIRQMDLKERYYFVCKCSRCDSDFDEEFDYEALIQLLEEFPNNLTKPYRMESFYHGLAGLKMMDIILGGVHPFLTLFLLRLVSLRHIIDSKLDFDTLMLLKRLGEQIEYTHSPRHELRKQYIALISSIKL